jgi:GNAT superfamily N-acetyltransferase
MASGTLRSLLMDVPVREYAAGDYPACRQLSVELTEHHRQIYGDRAIGGDDPGSGFDDYLDNRIPVNSWVAVVEGEVVGLTGLFDRGTSGEVEPVVVTGTRRRQGIGGALIEAVVHEAGRRGYEYLAIRPVARNVTAMRSFYDAGFRTRGGHVDLTMDLRERRHGWRDGAQLRGLDFRY